VNAAIIGLVLVAGCDLAENYLDLDGPRYAGDYAVAEPDERDQLVVVTYNLKFALELEAARDALASPYLAGADVIVMQEMNADGVDFLARELALRYVYYPGSVHERGDFGNAVLSPWPIVADHKLITPHADPFNDRRRPATAAVIEVAGTQLGVWSVHLAIPTLGLGYRLDQVEAIADDAVGFDGVRIVAGDYNTADPGSGDQTVATMQRYGYTWVSTGATETVERFGERWTLDYVFADGLIPVSSGVFAGDSGSDHPPVRAVLAWPP
jgi:endonuclease/exonuclease/phosphatase (EEP) superfamily protein YafD